MCIYVYTRIEARFTSYLAIDYLSLPKRACLISNYDETVLITEPEPRQQTWNDRATFI